MEYKVIKSFGIAKKGDIFKYNVDTNTFEMIDENNGFNRYMAIDCNTLEIYEKNGNVIELKHSNGYLEKTIKETIEFIDSLLEQYDSDLNETIRKFNNGEVQPCVKLEAETVYYNLTKVLKEIKSKLIA